MYMQARYYDPLIGRFYSNDPIGFRDVHSFNRYAYANNNPYKYIDPDGKAAESYLNRPGGVSIIQHQSAMGKPGGVAISRNPVGMVIGAAVGIIGVLNESVDPVDAIQEGKSPAKGEAGEKGQLEGTGGISGAKDDLGSIPLEEGSEWSSPDGSRQGGKIADGSGRKVNVHPSGGGDSYPQGTPTLEVQKPNGKTEVKIRYPEDKNS